MPRNLNASDVAKFRDRLCDVATQLLGEVGRDGFNMRELAVRLRVSAMTTYRYFKDKDEILAAVRARAFSRFADRLEIAAAHPGTAEERVSAICRAYADFAQEEPIHYRLMFDLSKPQNGVTAEFREEELRARAVLTKQICYCVGEGNFDADTDLIGDLLWSALHGATALHLIGTFRDAEFEHILMGTMRAFANGVFTAGFPARWATAASVPSVLSEGVGRTSVDDYSRSLSLSPAE